MSELRFSFGKNWQSFRRTSLDEKAIAEAEARGRTAATAELAVELVDAALEAKSAGRLKIGRAHV